MALGVAQIEELSSLLHEVPGLVDGLESRNAAYAGEVLAWLRRMEKSLENHRLAAVSQVSACRAMLVQADRGVHDRDVTFVGRPTPRKVQEASASLALRRANEIVHGLIAGRQSVFEDAERIAGQVVVVAAAKGYVRECAAGRSGQQFLQCLNDRVAADADLVSAHAHLLAMVGKTDVLVFLDRALARVQ
jgi:hypothetical protein